MNSVNDTRARMAANIHLVNGYWDWDEWKSYSDIHLFDDLVGKLHEEAFQFSDKFDIIGGLGRSGIPLASHLAHRLLKNQGIVKEWFIISDPDVSPYSEWIRPYKPSLALDGKHVLVVDADIKTGYTGWDAMDKIRLKGAIPYGFLAIIDYVYLPERKMYQRLKDEGVRIVKLFDLIPPADAAETNPKTSWLVEAQ